MQSITDKTFKLPFYLIMVVVTSIVLWLTIDLTLAFHVQQPLFLTNLGSFFNSLTTPGGLANYLAGFFTTLYYFPFWGALIVSLLISTLPLLIFQNAIKKTSFLLAILLSCTIELISVLLFLDYTFMLENLIAIIGAFIFAGLNIQLFRKISSVSLTGIIIAISIIIAYLFLGGAGALLSAGIFIIRVMFENTHLNRKIIASGIAISVTMLIPLLAVKALYPLLPLSNSYFGLFVNMRHYQNPEILYVLCSVVIIFELVAGFNLKRINFASNWHNWLVYAGFIILMMLLPKFLLNKTEKKELLVDYYACYGKWDKVLQVADANLQQNYMVAFQVNRALHFTGNLLENAFDAPQTFGTNALFIEANINPYILMPTSDIYYDLGFINESRHWAHEAYTRLGKQPRVLKRLVQVNIVNQKYNTAQKYILLLKKSLLYKKWAVEQEKYLNNEIAINNNLEYKNKRALIPVYDFFSNKNYPESNLANLINQPALNHMAMEYMLTDFLLKHDLIHIVKNVSLFKEFGYKTLPRLVQEGIILYMFKTNQPTINLAGYQLSAQNIERFKEYSKLYTLYKNNDGRAKETLDQKYANSFWYYIHFNSPITKQNKKTN